VLWADVINTPAPKNTSDNGHRTWDIKHQSPGAVCSPCGLRNTARYRVAWISCYYSYRFAYASAFQFSVFGFWILSLGFRKMLAKYLAGIAKNYYICH